LNTSVAVITTLNVDPILLLCIFLFITHFTTQPASDIIQSRMLRWWAWRDLEGGCLDVIETLTLYLREGTEEKNEQLW